MVSNSRALNASDMLSLKNATFIKIEKNVSKNFIMKIEQKAKQRAIDVIINPKVDCLKLGFTKQDIFAKGVMMGTNRTDGSLVIDSIGDFKAYRYIRYIKGKRECREIDYTKEYDPNRYGKYSYIVAK